MRTRSLFLNRLEATPEPQDVVVVIDVLRSFSTAAYAFTAGAAAIHSVETAAEAIELQQALPQSVTTGHFPAATRCRASISAIRPPRWPESISRGGN